MVKHRRYTPPLNRNFSIIQQGTVQLPLRNNLTENIRTVQASLGNSSDLVKREVLIPAPFAVKGAILYMEGLIDDQLLNQFVLTSLLVDTPQNLPHNDGSPQQLLESIQRSALTIGKVRSFTIHTKMVRYLLEGHAILLLDQCPKGLALSIASTEFRAIEEPTNQVTIRGPRDSFTETITKNTVLIRRRLKDRHLRLEVLKVGHVSQTNVGLMYLTNIADKNIVTEIRDRLKAIQVDGILESGNLEEFLLKDGYSPFPMIYNTERPDVVCANLLEGKVAIIVDGTPFVLIAPAYFIQFLQSAEDYYEHFDITLFLRTLRYLSFFVAMLGPAIYIAITTFHQEMLPTQLLLSLTTQREGIPFPAFVEALIMEITFEILREAGVRMPRPIGQAISIVGALVIGQAAAQAGFVTPAMVIIVSITALSSFIIPAYNLAIAIRMLRFLMMVLAATLGYYGILIGLFGVLIHLCSLNPFGVPYLTSFAPMDQEAQKDTIYRAPIWSRSLRPRHTAHKNPTRQ
ncbi:spore germination protein [Heliophilum fasciatum]|uniref:Spore germination protein KA n=1 Tax=Heliophilum fasciatum TaxID=35700 RepID=A0A4R2RY97_9FIRM|nr:spore germination protein [Heliophilum fasciatum]MCW2277623.1 spore germination protein KA [Heliophilum fasciatum]TCP64971.1 spore germination protein KA [Heliophilum fasciatum]